MGTRKIPTKSQYEDLAAFRFELRQFLRFSEEAAAAAGVTAQQYQAFDATAITTELLLGAAFGGLLGPRARAAKLPPADAIPPSALSRMKDPQADALTADHLDAMTKGQLKALKGTVADAFEPEQFGKMTADDAKSMATAFRKALLKEFSDEEEAKLPAEFLAALKG